MTTRALEVFCSLAPNFLSNEFQSNSSDGESNIEFKIARGRRLIFGL